MKSNSVLRQKFPKVRRVLVKGDTYYQVDARQQGTNGRRETFSTEGEALERAREIEKDRDAYGKDAMMPFQSRAMALRCIHRLEAYSKTLEQATDHYIAHLEKEKSRMESAPIEEVADDWCQKKYNDKLREKSLIDIRETRNLLKRLFTGKRVAEITEGDIIRFIQNQDVSDRRKVNLVNRFGQFFNWAKKWDYTDLNPCEYVRDKLDLRPAEITVQILPVEACEALMRACEKSEHADLRPYVAICLFAGVRPKECRLLNWDAIHFEEQEIVVPKSISKVHEQRPIRIEKNLFAWLAPYNGQKGPIAPRKNFVKKFKALRRAAGFSIGGSEGEDWIGDVLRHSYASYFLPIYNDRALLSEYMGNSASVIKKHYKVTVSSKKATAFWSIYPADTSEIEKNKLNIMHTQEKLLKNLAGSFARYIS